MYAAMQKAHADNIIWFSRGLPGTHEPIIGKNCVLGWGSIIDCAGQIIIEDNVFFGHRVMVLTGMHDYMKFGLDRMYSCIQRTTTIKEGAWICSGAIICPGVTIGKHAVVAAGSVVMKNVQPYTLVAGNPAQRIRKLR